MERTLTGSIVIIGAAAIFTAGALFYEPGDSSPAIPVTPAAPAEGRQPAGGRGARTPAAAVTPTLEISDFSFSAVTVPAGAAVAVANRDGTAHTVTAADGSFDVAVKGGSAASFTAPVQAGTYELVCSIHPSMAGVLTVTS